MQKSENKAQTTPVRQPDTVSATRSDAKNKWPETDIIALQEKARRFRRHYPAGGYQGL